MNQVHNRWDADKSVLFWGISNSKVLVSLVPKGEKRRWRKSETDAALAMPEKFIDGEAK